MTLQQAQLVAEVLRQNAPRYNHQTRRACMAAVEALTSMPDTERLHEQIANAMDVLGTSNLAYKILQEAIESDPGACRALLARDVVENPYLTNCTALSEVDR
jgi:hypothetical protein